MARIRTDPATGRPAVDGKIHLAPDGLLPRSTDRCVHGHEAELEFTGVNGNWWIGLSALHTLFAREHNADLRPPEDRLPGQGRRLAVREGAADPRRPDRQDPHGRVDPGPAQHAGAALRHARELVGRPRRRVRARLRPRSATAKW